MSLQLSRRAGALSTQQQRLLTNLNGLVVQSSILSVADLFPGSPPGNVSIPGYFYAEVWVLQGLDMQTGDFAASLDSRAAFQPCITARDVATCCLSSQQCCVDSQCQYPSSVEVAFGFTIVQQNMFPSLSSDVYEVELGMFPGDPFQLLDSRAILNGTAVVHVTKRPAVAVEDVSYIIRLPMSEALAVSMLESKEFAPACLRWNPSTLSWSTFGVTQSRGFTATKRMCANTSSAVTCSYFIECSSSYTGYFTIVKSKLDCFGVPLGSAVLDACGVCNGDNSTCSGCNGIPNMYDAGVKLDKACSGHGQCQGSPQCVCCSDNKYEISYTSPDGQVLTTCPWFGPRATSGSSSLGATQTIDCSSHGRCETVNGTLTCACDLGWENSDGKFCNKEVVVVQSLSRSLQLFFYAGLPIICCFLLMFTFLSWRHVSRKHRNILKVSKEVNRSLLELETSSQVAGEVQELSEESSTTHSHPEDHNVPEVGKDEGSRAIQLVAGKELEIPSVTAFLTTSKFEAISDTCPSDPVVMKTFQRLERLKQKISSDKSFRNVAETFHDHVDMNKLAKAGERMPTSLKKAKVEEDAQVEVPGGFMQQRQRKMMAISQGRAASALPSFMERKKEMIRRKKSHEVVLSSGSNRKKDAGTEQDKSTSTSSEGKSSSNEGAIASV
ncbi:hypothetical protein GUITHDRAFT_154792 [Guillardia theta CCMP2712]|uniref:EGF-like domain-containing protein n=1 Tax=Guillardia theta (strain CCMP2712) TaxID=905079 RepID=L1IQB3_GUITC|nr:hypothetical protein GUITHDRAFT_154792 [Guillardia theta CCMP2712]EKX38015.1 hypothetical protein GUITHDRAFT_154792 [Guillardia theta CCMP2712]|eukprot:XP_005824995.1 hypothetical protein GUITHDRAFT_154792 [Guillardia theta CCMP2712]